MASITLSGTILDPGGFFAIGDKIRFTHETNTGKVVKSSMTEITIPTSGSYLIDVQYGMVSIDYQDVKSSTYTRLGSVTVNQDSTATTIPELLNSSVPPTDEQLLEFQELLQDCKDQVDLAEGFAEDAEQAVTDINALTGQQTTAELINSSTVYDADKILETSGFTTAGDGGAGKWKQNGVTGQTPSQTPEQLSDALLNDANGNQWYFVSSKDSVDPRVFGALGNDSNNDSVTVNIAISTGIDVYLDYNLVYIVENLQAIDKTVIKGKGTLKAASGASGGGVIIAVSNVDFVTFKDITFDGNTGDVTSFDNVVQLFNTRGVSFIRTKHKNSRGISVLGSGCAETKFSKCSFNECGIYNRTTLDLSDRKQAIAFTGGGKDNWVDQCTFEDVGLDCVSMASGENGAKCTSSLFRSNDAGTIYFSNCTNFLISGNTVNNITGGNGIDVPKGKKGIISNNIVYNCGSTGVLLAEESSNIMVLGNTIYNNNNKMSGTNQGGITLYLVNSDNMDSITIANNTCFDDQGLGSVTQRYPLDINNAGSGEFTNINIYSDNNMKGYNSSGAESNSAILRQSPSSYKSTVLNLPIIKNYSNLDSIAVCKNNESAMLQLNIVNSNDYMRVAIINGNVKSIDDTGSLFLNSDSGTGIAVYDDGSNITLKNRTGSTRSIQVWSDDIAKT